jgi:hypothetical protein
MPFPFGFLELKKNLFYKNKFHDLAINHVLLKELQGLALK